MILFIWGSQNSQTDRDRKLNEVARGWVRGNRELLFNEESFSLENEKVLEMEGGDGCITQVPLKYTLKIA